MNCEETKRLQKGFDEMTIEERVNEANRQVLEILTKGRPRWVDVRPALEVIPGMTDARPVH